jgi:tetratricopeptide (TPR) repeat protein
MTPRLHCMTLLATALLFVSPAPAAPTVPTTSVHAATSDGDAEARYRAGVNAFAAGRYSEAVELFRDADRRKPSAALSFNMARAYEKLGDVAGALRSYRDYLRRAKDPEDGAAVRRFIDVLSRRLAAHGVQQVTVLSTPPGATVTLDGVVVGVTPWTSELTPGAHEMSLHLAEHADVVRSFDLPAYEALDVSVPLYREKAKPTPVRGADTAMPSTVDVTPERLPEDGTAPAPRSRLSRPIGILGITALGVGGAALGSALVFEILRADAEREAKGEHEQILLADDLERAKAHQTTARVLAGVGAGLAAAGGVLLLVNPSETPQQDRRPTMKLNATPTAVTAAVFGRF